MNFSDNNNRYQGFGYTPPPTPEDNSREPVFAPEPSEFDPFARNSDVPPPAQDYRSHSEVPFVPPISDIINNDARKDPAGYRFEHGAFHLGETRHAEWHEPKYSEPRESTSGMYTPGICVSHPHSRNRLQEFEPEREIREYQRPRGGFLRAVCLIVVCVMLSGVASYGVMEYRFNRGDFTPINQVVLGGSPTHQNGEGVTAPINMLTQGMSSQDIYDMAVTQVVGITIEVPTSSPFGNPNSSSTSSGSGFIISSDGYILTNYHVIESAYLNNIPLTVSLSDGTEYLAEIIGFEASNDVALIKIEATGLNPAIIANSDNIRVGQPVYAIGNPFGNLVYTMTDGIVSALDREVTVDGKIISTFQFSAAVNRGNSGGPVYDANGEVLGIVTAKLIRNDVEGIGFAIPINDAIEIASGLIEHGYIAGRPLIGITAQTVSSGHAEYYGWVVGTYVRSVNPGSAAQKAGLLVGDIITQIGDTEVDSMEALRFAMRKYKAGDTANITVWRSGDVFELTITFDEDLAAGQPNRQQPEAQEPLPEPELEFPQLPRRIIPQP